MAAAAFRAAALALTCAACTSIAADARTFENTRWRVTAVNGRETPPKGEYQITFRDGIISGRFGCNGFGGQYSMSGATLVTREIRSTLMGCPEPAGSFESAGLTILNQPMRIEWRSSREPRLANSAGSIDLALLR